jgi:cysteine synthase A
MRPPLCEVALIDNFVLISDLDCVVGCRRLMDREAIFAGGSSGGVMAAVEARRASFPPGSRVVALLPDRGERYLATLFSDEWVHAHFGEVRSLWRPAP